MPTYPEPQKSWNSIVRKTVKGKVMQVELKSPNNIVGHVKKGEKYYLRLRFKNTSSLELVYNNIVIRLVGKSNQIDFIDPPGAIDYKGNPRIHLETGRLSSGQTRNFTIIFKARKNMGTKSLKFNTGMYGYIEPQGHYWKTLSPKH